MKPESMESSSEIQPAEPGRAYAPPTVTVLGAVREFTFGSMFSSNDSTTQHGGHHTGP